MWILDRQRYWAFLKAYIICFCALVGLYIVIHAFSNLDEFTEVADGTVDLFRRMGWYYLVHMSEFYDRLCGVMTMMAAIFTVTWMQRNNELLAMLAAGLSTQRVIRPVLISAVLVNVVAVVNQEVIAPRVGEELLRDPDDDGVRKVMVYSRYDVNGILIHGKDGDRGSQTVMEFSATIPSGVYGTAIGLDAKQARYIPEDASDAPMRGGWLVRGTTRTPADVPIDGEPRLVYLIDDEAMLKKFPPPTDKVPMNLSGDTYFLRTNISFDAVTRNRHWYQFASTPDLIRALSDPANEPERVEIEVALHTRLLRPLLALTLLVLSLPQVLGGDSRNMFVNLGLALGTSAVFYGALFLVQFVGNNGLISPELVAWGPLIGFGTVAAAGWDNIRT